MHPENWFYLLVRMLYATALPISPTTTHCITSPSSILFFSAPFSKAGSSRRPLQPARLSVREERCPPVEKALSPPVEREGRRKTRWYSARASRGTGEVSCKGERLSMLNFLQIHSTVG